MMENLKDLAIIWAIVVVSSGAGLYLMFLGASYLDKR